MEQIRRIMRPTDVPDTGLLCDLLWSDPDKDVQGWGENDRGVSFTFGADVVTKFLHRHDLDLICRAHQVVEDGYEFFAKRQLVTLFSAPNYCGEFDNAGGMMSVDETLMCSFQVSVNILFFNLSFIHSRGLVAISIPASVSIPVLTLAPQSISLSLSACLPACVIPALYLRKSILFSKIAVCDRCNVVTQMVVWEMRQMMLLGRPVMNKKN